MRKVIPKNIADEMTKPYIDDAVEKQIKAADVPPRNKLNISFENAGRIDDNKEYKSNQEAYEKNHGKLYDMTHKNTVPWKNYVVYLVLLSLLTTAFTFSKYMSSAGIHGNNVSVASFNPIISYVDNSVPGVTVITPDKAMGVLFASPTDTATKALTYKIENDSGVTVEANISVSGTLSGAQYSFVEKDESGYPKTTETISPITMGETRTVTLYIVPNVDVNSNLILGEIKSNDFKIIITVDQVD